MEKPMAVDGRFFCEKGLHDRCFPNSFPVFKNSYRRASDMTCFTDIYLRLKEQNISEA